MSVTMLPKNSIDSPLHIAELEVSKAGGRLGLTLCPGKKDLPYRWARDLKLDLRAVHAWGASTVVTLIEDHEFSLLGVEDLGAQILEMGMTWVHLPIRDIDVPDHRFESGWTAVGSLVHERLDAGERILIHCRGGLGRTGLVAGLILTERGVAPRDAVLRVRAARPHAIETSEQENYVRRATRTTRISTINAPEGKHECHS